MREHGIVLWFITSMILYNWRLITASSCLRKGDNVCILRKRRICYEYFLWNCNAVEPGFLVIRLSSMNFVLVLENTSNQKVISDNKDQWLRAGPSFSQCTLVSSTNKTDRHDIAKILLKVVLNTLRIKQTSITDMQSS